MGLGIVLFVRRIWRGGVVVVGTKIARDREEEEEEGGGMVVIVRGRRVVVAREREGG